MFEFPFENLYNTATGNTIDDDISGVDDDGNKNDTR